ncbi:hypothetical protein KI743_18285 [Vibrio sp. D420a]|uniref:hypothetical protein n=1 Tax=Vibrio sp. D420a TaxID=2836895 RepID=UPI002557B312|nr:hypothetical protein [Vibrio sp. D420a]MDK9763958.1 hypothetical protein [Vibrio sp. D420a]
MSKNTRKRNKIYNALIEDSIDPDAMDYQLASQIADLTIIVEETKQAIEDEGFIIKQQSTKGTVITRANPLVETYRSIQANLSSQLTRFSNRQDRKQAQLIKDLNDDE